MTDPASLKARIVHAPHQPLTDYYSSEHERRDWLKGMFDSTASSYNIIETIFGFGTGPWYRRQALLRAGLVPGMHVVDIGTGTGLVATQAVAILGDPTSVIGVDPSVGMLENAKVPHGVKLVEGSAERIPFPDNSFDFLSMGYALRHISDLSGALTEFHRVLKPGGRICILEITYPRKEIPKFLLMVYLRVIVPSLARLFSTNRQTSILWRYYWDSIAACAPPESVLLTLSNADFESANRHVELGIFSEYRAIKPTISKLKPGK